MILPRIGSSLGLLLHKVQNIYLVLQLVPFDLDIAIAPLLFCLLLADEEIEDDPVKMKQFVLSRLGKVPDHVREVYQRIEPSNIIMSPLRYRRPWEVAWGNISKGTVCVAGDAFHPMTPDLGQGGCSALEDGVILARCLGQALMNNNSKRTAEEERRRIETGLKSYARERRWRAFELIATAFMVGYIQQSDGKVLSFLRDRVLPAFLAGKLTSVASFDCGKLSSS